MSRHRWALAAGALGGVLLGAGLIPSALGGFATTVAGPSSAGSGVVAETVDASCTAAGPVNPDATCPAGTSLLPASGGATSVTVANSGTVPESVGLTESSCGVATVTDSGTVTGASVVMGGVTPSSYGSLGGPLGGLSMSFSGASSSIATEGPASASPANYTELAWFKSAPGQYGALLGFANAQPAAAASTSDRQMWVDSSGHLVAGVSATSDVEVTSTAAVTNDTWHLAAATLSGSTFSLYLDGSLQQSDTSVSGVSSYEGWWTAAAARFASSGLSDPPPLSSGMSYDEGSLAGAAVLPTALDASAISGLYGAGSFTTYADLVSSYTPLVDWPLQDTSPVVATQLPGYATTFPDSSAAADNGTPVGTVSSAGTGGPLGGGESTFAGAPDYVSTDGAATAGPQSFTELAWTKVPPGGSGALLGFSDSSTPTSATDADRGLWVDSAGDLVAGVYPGSQREVTSSTAVADGTWHLVAATLGSSGFSLYVDGVLQQTDTSTTSAQSYNGWWSIGAAALAGWSDAPPTTSGVSYLTGSLAGVAVLPSALDASQISSLYGESSFAAYTSAVQSYSPLVDWPLTSQVATDLCASVLTTVSSTIGATTTCVLPVEPAGTGCPAASGGAALDSLASAPVTASPAVTAGTAAALTISVADASGVPQALVGADVVADLVVTATSGTWEVQSSFPGSTTAL